jgi:hypothetical protein
MPSAYLLPNGRTQFFNPLTGTFLSGGSVYTYAAGTSTPQSTWYDGNQVTVNPNPIVLDAYGSASIFWNGDYKVSVFDSLSNLVYTQDNMQTAGTLVAGQILGTATNDNAAAGYVGEYVTATATNSSLTSAAPGNIASISLTAGDWDVWGNNAFTYSVTNTNVMESGVSTTTATLPASPLNAELAQTITAGLVPTVQAPVQRLSFAITTTVYLVAVATFASGTLSVTGIIQARRRR